ncbi:Uncharacterised protein [Mycobacteroides abscessus subsp. abscessus]|nr:Uncharacterised protein [Mycobacteroides abscessus subsp. abscessus]SKT94101.1 Uncharacterised protein [Mycobacteroides abscessus subsp. abscessus]
MRLGSGRKVQHPKQFRNIYVLGRQAAAQDVIGVGHDLHRQAAQIRVQVPGRQVDPLPRFQRQPIQQQRGQHARVCGIALTQLQERAGLADEAHVIGGQITHRPVEHRGHQHIQTRLGKGDPGGEQGP